MRKQIDELEQIRDLMAEGYTRKQIAEKLGLNINTLKYYCRTRGIKSGTQEQTPDRINDSIRKPGNQAIYISGYSGRKSRIKVRCEICGGLFEIRYDWLISHKAICPICRDAKQKPRVDRDKKVAEKLAQAKERSIRRKELKEAAKEARRRERMHLCVVCGTMTDKPKYCCERCAKRASNKQSEIMRRVKLQGAMVDNDITLESLFKRDGGTCHICGGKCRLDDFTVRGGTFIAGNWYPSIDHVVPLAKGGKHAWNNVMLAHRICNSLKADKISPPP